MRLCACVIIIPDVCVSISRLRTYVALYRLFIYIIIEKSYKYIRILHSPLFSVLGVPSVSSVAFDKSSYDVMEGDTRSVCVVVSGVLASTLKIQVSTAEGSAKGTLHS